MPERKPRRRKWGWGRLRTCCCLGLLPIEHDEDKAADQGNASWKEDVPVDAPVASSAPCADPIGDTSVHSSDRARERDSASDTSLDSIDDIVIWESPSRMLGLPDQPLPPRPACVPPLPLWKLNLPGVVRMPPNSGQQDAPAAAAQPASNAGMSSAPESGLSGSPRSDADRQAAAAAAAAAGPHPQGKPARAAGTQIHLTAAAGVENFGAPATCVSAGAAVLAWDQAEGAHAAALAAAAAAVSKEAALPTDAGLKMLMPPPPLGDASNRGALRMPSGAAAGGKAGPSLLSVKDVLSKAQAMAPYRADTLQPPLPGRSRRPASALPKQAALAPAARLPQASARPAALGASGSPSTLPKPGSVQRPHRSLPVGTPPPRPPPTRKLPGPPPPGRVQLGARPPSAAPSQRRGSLPAPQGGQPNLASPTSAPRPPLPPAVEATPPRPPPRMRNAAAAAAMKAPLSPIAAILAKATGMEEVGGSLAHSRKTEWESPKVADTPTAAAALLQLAGATPDTARLGPFHTPREAFSPRQSSAQQAPQHSSPGWTPRGFVTARNDMAGSPTVQPGGFVTARDDLAGSPTMQPSGFKTARSHAAGSPTVQPTLVPTRAVIAGMQFTCATNPLFG